MNGSQPATGVTRITRTDSSFARLGGGGFQKVVYGMLRYTCDLCGKDMLPGDDRRFTVKMEVFAAHDPAELTDADLDQDHMDEIGEMLDELEEQERPPEDPTPTYKKLQYDLCPGCHKKFLSDPLGRESAQKFHFSEN